MMKESMKTSQVISRRGSGWFLTMTPFAEVKFASVNMTVYKLLSEFTMFTGLSIKVEIWRIVGDSCGESLESEGKA